MDGIIVINKPKGFTSFDIVAIMRKLCNIKKIGHSGTLDPMATGVLPILIGKATKLQTMLQNSQKEYIAEFKLGITTDSEDITGKVLTKKSVEAKKENIQAVLSDFRGKIKQIPPMYSAVQKDGVRLYNLARQGIEVEREPREVTIYKLELLSYDEVGHIGKILVKCSKGTYIRTLCADIGEKLACGATLTSLERTFAASFAISDSITLDEAKIRSQNGTLVDKLIPIDRLFKDYSSLTVTAAQGVRLKNGGALFLDRTDAKNAPDSTIFRTYDDEGTFLGLSIVKQKSGELSRLTKWTEVYEK
ncbi:MAG: tRNA pseudouridine synthase B [Eubacteriales bacterium SKADARSKE-1]|nr:tRNA pseudouridine synthase B [Eubacteriales bacterium SKADARSKE-1]